MSFPSLELLESTHKFPVKYVFKAIGHADNAFEARVVAAAREALKLEVDPPYEVRESSGGKHMALTLEPVVKSAQEILDVYGHLSKVPGLVMLL